MDEHDDLARRLAARLRPARIPGADETWRAIAPRLTPRRRAPRVWPRWLAAAALIASVVAILVTLRPSPRVVGPGGGATATTPLLVSDPPAASRQAATPGAATRTPTEGRGVQIAGGKVVGVEPALPFTLWQPGYHALSEYLIAYGYRLDGAPGTASAVVNTRGDGRDLDPALAAEVGVRVQRIAAEAPGTTMVLEYAADPSQVGVGAQPPAAAPPKLFELVQRSADGQTVPPGEAAWFSGTAATFVRESNGVVLTWLAGDTFFTLYTNQTPEAAVVFAQSLKPTSLVAPGTVVPAPTPTLTLPTVAPPRTPRATAAPCPTRRGAAGIPLICPSDPNAPAGTPTFAEADVRRQYAPESGYIGPFIATTTPTIATVEFLTAGAVGQRLGRGMTRPDDQPLCVITLAGDFILPPADQGLPPTAYGAVILILDARTGEWFGTTGSPR